MLISAAHIEQQIALICAILMAIGAGLVYLNWRGHLHSLWALRVPLMGFALFGLCDAIVTLHGTWQAPWREANPSMRAFLIWAGWRGQCLGSALWILAWTLVLDRIETLRCRMAGQRASILGSLRIWLVYALAIGHLNGLVSWTHTPYAVATLFAWFYRLWFSHAGWLMAISPFGYPLYSGLCFGGLCALIHTFIVRPYARVVLA